MGAKHTPGPWHLHPSGRPNILGSWTVFHGEGEGPHNQICAAENIDDARLIAAAPLMLEACEAVVAGELNMVSPATWDKIRAALAAARGEGA